MELENRLLQPFTKMKYLSEGHYRQYTFIINYLYKQHELYYAPPSLTSSILEYIVKNNTLGIFEDYTLQKLEVDLKQLEEWGNVISHQDSGNVQRIEDFNNRKLRYQCTKETIEIERLMEKLQSKKSLVEGSLDPNLVSSLAATILKIEKYQDKKEFTKKEKEKLIQLWDEMFVRFEKLRKESSDYLGIINSKNIEEAMQTREITPFRLKFTEYLTGFIVALQQNIYLIEYSINKINEALIYRIIDILIENQRNKPLLDELDDEQYRDIFANQWSAIQKWFIYNQFDERYIDYLLKQTGETISRFTKYLEQMSEREQNIRNRKRSFEHIARLFSKEEDLSLCFKSFAVLTNIEKPLHFISQEEKDIDSKESIRDQESSEVKSLKAASVFIRNKITKTPSITITEEDKAIMEQIQREKEYEEKKIDDLIKRGVIRLKDLEFVEPFMRKLILQWISQCNGKQKMVGKTDRGVSYRLEKMSDEIISLGCVDGTLHMDDYQIVFHER